MSSPRLAWRTCRAVLRPLLPAGALVLAGVLVGIAPAGASASACVAFTGVQPPSPGIGNFFNGVTVRSSCNAWAVGDDTNGGTVFQTLIEHWNGSAWHRVRSPDPPGTNVLRSVAATSANNVWAVGDNGENTPLIEHWNGTAWKVVKSPGAGSGSVLTSVAASSKRHAWAVGSDASGTFALRWNGTRWRHVASPDLGIEDVLNGVTAISARNVWAVGFYNNLGVSDSLIEHWDGSTWRVVASPSPNPGTHNPLDGIAATSSRNIWAVGDYVINGTGQRALALHCC